MKEKEAFQIVKSVWANNYGNDEISTIDYIIFERVLEKINTNNTEKLKEGENGDKNNKGNN